MTHSPESRYYFDANALFKFYQNEIEDAEHNQITGNGPRRKPLVHRSVPLD